MHKYFKRLDQSAIDDNAFIVGAVTRNGQKVLEQQNAVLHPISGPKEDTTFLILSQMILLGLGPQ